MQSLKNDKIEILRKEILDLQGIGVRHSCEQLNVALGPILKHMPGGIFPTGAVHEFLSASLESAAATTGFIIAILHSLMQSNKPCLWVSSCQVAFPPGMKLLGAQPDKFIFINTEKEKEALWAIEEGLKCASLSAVVGEINNLDFKQSRRLQLAVEKSNVTGFLNRLFPQSIRPTACVSRWEIRPASSRLPAGLPGIGLPSWKVDLQKIRNGRTGSWQIQWSDNCFKVLQSASLKVESSFYQTASA